MKFTNKQIYQITDNLLENIKNLDVYIPAKANFFLQKNIQLFVTASQEIEEARLKIAKHYGELDEEKQCYIIQEDKKQEAFKELEDLSNLEQDLDIKTFSIEALGTSEFTSNQMQSIMFMIED